MAAEPRLERDTETSLLRWCNTGLEASLLYALLAAWARPREGPAALLPIAACLAIPAALALRRAIELTTVSAPVRYTAVVISALAWALTAARLVAPAGYWQSDAPRALLVAGAMFGGPIAAGHQPLAFWASVLLWWRGYLLLEWLPNVDDALGRFRLGSLAAVAAVGLAALPEIREARGSIQLEQAVAVAAFFGFAALTTGLTRRREMAGGTPAAPTLANGSGGSRLVRSLVPLLMIAVALAALAIAAWGAESVTPAVLTPFVALGGEILAAIGAAATALAQLVVSLWPTPGPRPPSEQPPPATPDPSEPFRFPHFELPGWLGPLIMATLVVAGLAMVGHLFILASRAWFNFSTGTIGAVHGEDTTEPRPATAQDPIAVLAVLLRLFRSILHRPAATAGRRARGGSAARREPELASIRGAYRELLTWAAARGWPRRVDETPDEFRRRLVGLCPRIGPEATLLTTLYVTARYGGRICPHPDLRRARLAITRLRERRAESRDASDLPAGPADRRDVDP